MAEGLPGSRDQVALSHGLLLEIPADLSDLVRGKEVGRKAWWLEEFFLGWYRETAQNFWFS